MIDSLVATKSLTENEKRLKSILQIACKKAVKGGDDLSMSDLTYLVDQMLEQHVTPTCPHGRPIVVSLSQQEMEKWFKRIV